MLGEVAPTLEQRLSDLSSTTGDVLLVLNSEIDFDCFQAVRNELAKNDGDQNITLILNSPGGSIEFAFWIAKSIREECGHLDVIVPNAAKSAATLIALAADRILLGQLGDLGPLDPQMPDPGGTGPRSPLQIVKGLDFLRNYYLEAFDVTVLFLLDRAGMDVPRTMDRATALLSPVAESLYSSVDYRELGEASRDLAVSEAYATEVMRRWSPLDEGLSETIVRQLVWEYPDHGHIIDVEEANRIGLSNVDYMYPQLESLLAETISSPTPFIKIFLPNSESDLDDSERSLNKEGEENECDT